MVIVDTKIAEIGIGTIAVIAEIAAAWTMILTITFQSLRDTRAAA